jgi:transposase
VARFHPTLLTLCAAMRVEPKLCAVRKPRQKGKVERAIRYLLLPNIFHGDRGLKPRTT